MKWNKRLKSFLTKTENGEILEDCLKKELTKTDKTPHSLVSSVFVSDEFRHLPENRTISDEPEKHKNLVSSVFVSAYSRDSFKNNDEQSDFKTDYFHSVLNRFIEAGVTFDVSADNFLFIDPAQTLKLSDMEFLKINSAAILCQLQQSLLMKHLFNHAPEQFEDFAFEIRELEAIILANRPETELRITDKTQFQIYFDAVNQTTRKWFADLLTDK